MGKTKDHYFTALNEYKQKYKTEKVISHTSWRFL